MNWYLSPVFIFFFVEERRYIIIHFHPLRGTRVFSIILFAGLLSGKCCFAGPLENDSMVKASNQSRREILLYIGFVGRKMIKPLRKTASVIEVYKLPPALVMQLNKLKFLTKRYDYKTHKKQQLLLSSLKDSCQVYNINNPVKYKYFYPQGLKKRDGNLHKWIFAMGFFRTAKFKAIG